MSEREIQRIARVNDQLRAQLDEAGFGGVITGWNGFGPGTKVSASESATKEQIRTAQAVLDSFSWEESADIKADKIAWDAAREEAKAIIRKYRNAEPNEVDGAGLAWALLQTLTPEEPAIFDMAMKASK